jgi:hypothetical protein
VEAAKTTRYARADSVFQPANRKHVHNLAASAEILTMGAARHYIAEIVQEIKPARTDSAFQTASRRHVHNLAASAEILTMGAARHYIAEIVQEIKPARTDSAFHLAPINAQAENADAPATATRFADITITTTVLAGARQTPATITKPARTDIATTNATKI